LNINNNVEKNRHEEGVTRAMLQARRSNLKPKWERKRFSVGLNNEPGSLKVVVQKQAAASITTLQTTIDAVLTFKNSIRKDDQTQTMHEHKINAEGVKVVTKNKVRAIKQIAVHAHHSDKH